MKLNFESLKNIRPLNSLPVAIITLAWIKAFVLWQFSPFGEIMAVVTLIFGTCIGISLKIANQWEKAVVLRFGKFKGLKGPGIFFIIPFVDTIYSYIDQRIRVTDFNAEKTLTRDTVPVNVDAVVYWTVWDVEKTALEVQEYRKAVSYIAQTVLRDVIGKHDLADLIHNREQVGADLRTILDEHTEAWGITCQTVGIKDIIIPEDLADAMSRQAQAERERQARIILGSTEADIAEDFNKAGKRYIDNPLALQLRGMNMLFEGLKDKGSMVIVPSSALDSMNLGAVGGLTALAKGEMEEKNDTTKIENQEKD